MKKVFFFLLTTLISIFGNSQNHQLEFDKYFKIQDTVNQLKTLKSWEKQNPKDAELYTSYFNYYFSKSREQVLALTNDHPNGESLVIKDSSNQNVGFIGDRIIYNQEILQKGIEKINQGIKLFPNRLDMRFGKIYAFGQIEDWDSFTDEIIETIEQSSKNNNHWTWTNNEKYGSDVKGFLLDIQNYQLQLYNTRKDELLLKMRAIANKVLSYHPNHIESLSNLSITYLLKDEYDKALEPLFKAEKLNPQDYIVLGNIAQAYKLKGDKEKAILYYEKTAEFGDDYAKAYAKQEIARLKNDKK